METVTMRNVRWLGVGVVLAIASGVCGEPATKPQADPMRQITAFNFKTLGQAIDDLADTYGAKYSEAPGLHKDLSSLAKTVGAAKAAAAAGKRWDAKKLWDLSRQLHACKRRVMLSNPALKGLRILCVRRGWKRGIHKNRLTALGIPSNHECHSVLPRLGYDNEIAVFDAARPKATWKTLYKPSDSGFVGHVDLHWNADRLIFAKADKTQWKIWEMRITPAGRRASAPRQVSRTPDDIDCFDACYLPDGRILCGSNATAQCVPCWHGVDRKYVANLFTMNADGSGMRRVTFDQDHDTHPSVLNNGQVVYQRWDYTGMNRIFLRPLMVMNPDGTGQRALYGSNSWFPNGLYFPHELPGRRGRLLSVLAGYHGPGRSGHLVVVDTSKGTQEAEGIVQRISGTGKPLDVKIMDTLTVDAWPKFHTPAPVTDKQFLVSAWMSQRQRSMGIYLVDVFDNVLCLYRIEGQALLEPIPLIKRKVPPVLSDRVVPTQRDATVFLHDIHVGPGLAGVPRGQVKSLRVIAYHFGYISVAGNDKIGLSGPWDAMQILGTTPVERDGSAIFRIPANTPVAFQALDAEGKAVQLMRTWFTAMGGENVSCIGCHESPGTTAPIRRSIASGRPPRDLDPWYGPARGFDFAREVQPVLNRYCVGCHDGRRDRHDLRPAAKVPGYKGRIPGRLDSTRMHPTHRKLHDGRVRYTPAYEALLPYVRRVNVGDGVSLLDPGHYHADTSELIQMLRKGHRGVRLDAESFSRLVTWIDLNGPCHGTWRDVFASPMPSGGHKRRMELFKLYGGPGDDPERIPKSDPYDQTPVKPAPLPKPKPLVLDGWPFDGAARRKALDQSDPRSIDLGDGVSIAMVKVPAGRFVMGDLKGQRDEWPLAKVTIGRPFWMGVCEISNAQFRRFKASHDSGYYVKRHATRGDDKGLALNEPRQPALRVSWTEATAFCHWLSRRTGLTVSLPTEAQWEYACRAGSDAPMHYGPTDKDFAPFANLADKTFATVGFKGRSLGGYFVVAGDVDLISAEGVDLANRRYDDKGCATMPIGSYRPNAFGLKDMHGNAAEWTVSTYRPYPYKAADERNDAKVSGEKVVRGGSFLDRPSRCRSAARYSFPPWQKVHNVGFRIVVNQPSLKPANASK